MSQRTFKVNKPLKQCYVHSAVSMTQVTTDKKKTKKKKKNTDSLPLGVSYFCSFQWHVEVHPADRNNSSTG